MIRIGMNPNLFTIGSFTMSWHGLLMLLAGLAGVTEHGAGLASGLLNTTQQIGGAIGVAIASYTLVDKDGIRYAAALPYLELVLLPLALVALPTVYARRGGAALRAQLDPATLAAAVGSFGAYALFLVALRLARAPAVAAVRETSVVVAAGLAAIFLRERVTAERLAGAAAVAGGVALLALS